MRIDKFFIISLLILGAFVIYQPNLLGDNRKANIWISDEREFFKPIDVVWRGKIISTMASGSCIGLEGDFDNYSQAMACLPNSDPNELWNLEEVVTISGKWTGITCAYKNTIFGECVPDVVIKSIEQ